MGAEHMFKGVVWLLRRNLFILCTIYFLFLNYSPRNKSPVTDGRKEEDACQLEQLTWLGPLQLRDGGRRVRAAGGPCWRGGLGGAGVNLVWPWRGRERGHLVTGTHLIWIFYSRAPAGEWSGDRIDGDGWCSLVGRRGSPWREMSGEPKGECIDREFHRRGGGYRNTDSRWSVPGSGGRGCGGGARACGGPCRPARRRRWRGRWCPPHPLPSTCCLWTSASRTSWNAECSWGSSGCTTGSGNHLRGEQQGRNRRNSSVIRKHDG